MELGFQDVSHTACDTLGQLSPLSSLFQFSLLSSYRHFSPPPLPPPVLAPVIPPSTSCLQPVPTVPATRRHVNASQGSTGTPVFKGRGYIGCFALTTFSPVLFIIIVINPLTARVVGAPQMILQPVFSIFSLFSTALWDLANSRPVHSLMLSSHLFLCPLCLLPPFTVPCKMVLARPAERET